MNDEFTKMGIQDALYSVIASTPIEINLLEDHIKSYVETRYTLVGNIPFEYESWGDFIISCEFYNEDEYKFLNLLDYLNDMDDTVARNDNFNYCIYKASENLVKTYG